MMARPSLRAFYGMADVSRHDRHYTRLCDLCHFVDGHLEFALDHFIDFLLRMEMLVDGRAAREVIVRESHARRVKISSMPTWQALNDIEGAGVDERHWA